MVMKNGLKFAVSGDIIVDWEDDDLVFTMSSLALKLAQKKVIVDCVGTMDDPERKNDHRAIIKLVVSE